MISHLSLGGPNPKVKSTPPFLMWKIQQATLLFKKRKETIFYHTYIPFANLLSAYPHAQIIILGIKKSFDNREFFS